jgi:hypothetical protein
MSIISVYETDKSNILYKRFASLASSYIDEPETAKAPTAQVPLENLYRLFEMFRYNAFSDQNRSGILAVDKISNNISFNPAQEEWHTKIEQALSNALSNVYKDEPKNVAIDKLENVLKWLANESTVNDDLDSQIQAKIFFERFVDELNK